MSASAVITLQSPERGWPPFTEWLAEQGVDPTLCWEVELSDGEDPRCIAHLYATDEDGKMVVVGSGDEQRLAIREPVAFIANRPAPRRAPGVEG